MRVTQSVLAQVGFAVGTSAAAISSTYLPITTVTLGNITVNDLWDLYVGPVQVAKVTTVVAATPIPSSELIPPPFIRTPPQLKEQVPIARKNESWQFPKGFWWGVAGAAYQTEGAAKDEGRGPSIWDVMAHRAPNYVLNNDTGDIADNHYYLYKEDIARIAAQGVKTYSFSISWSRVLPFGKGPVNELALTHYDDVINTCIEYGIEPTVTLLHYDLPAELQNTYGGWLSPDVVGDFLNYAEIVFKRFGDRVVRWVTVNEPTITCLEYPLPHNLFRDFGVPKERQTIMCMHHLLLSHGKAYRLAKSLGIVAPLTYKNNGGPKLPNSNSTEDSLATQRSFDFYEGWWSHPIFIDGDYPPSIKSTSGVPILNDKEKEILKGSSDFFAIDAYTANYVKAPEGGVDACLENISHPLYPKCFITTTQYPESEGSWLVGPSSDPASSWAVGAPAYIPQYLHYVQDTYKPVGGIAITEFGFAEPFESFKTQKPDILFDAIRVQFFHDYMEAVLLAISEGVNVIGCTAWSIMDNFEWQSGYRSRFGLQYVNYTTQERSFKASFYEYVNTFKLYGSY